MKRTIFYRNRCICISILFVLIMCAVCLQGHAQVTIGSGIEPAPGSLLDLKQKAADADNSTAAKGLNLPRVNLTQVDALYPMFLQDPKDSQSGPTQEYNDNKGDIDKEHTGMVVFNVGTTLTEGVYYWDGEQWKIVDNVVASSPTINEILCSSISADKQKLVDGQAFETLVRVPYTGGNGAVYAAGDTIPCSADGIQGLKAQLQAGKLANGAGELTYRVWADAVSMGSATVAKFPISFPKEGGGTATCEMTLGGSEAAHAMTESYVTIGPLAPTTQGEDNGVPGFERVVTTPDGRWSMRAFIPESGKDYGKLGGTGMVAPGYCLFNMVDISIRANSMDKDRTIMWAAKTIKSGVVGSGSNKLTIPQQYTDKWCGNNGDDAGAWSASTSLWVLGPYTGLTLVNNVTQYYQVSFSASNVMDTATPQNRIYTFTEIGDSKTAPYSPRTVYTITFMMGVTAGYGDKTVATGNLSQSTVYFKVEQSVATE